MSVIPRTKLPKYAISAELPFTKSNLFCFLLIFSSNCLALLYGQTRVRRAGDGREGRQPLRRRRFQAGDRGRAEALRGREDSAAVRNEVPPGRRRHAGKARPARHGDADEHRPSDAGRRENDSGEDLL